MENLDKVYANRIAEEYAPKVTTKVVKLKKLDKKVKNPCYYFCSCIWNNIRFNCWNRDEHDNDRFWTK